MEIPEYRSGVERSLQPLRRLAFIVHVSRRTSGGCTEVRPSRHGTPWVHNHLDWPSFRKVVIPGVVRLPTHFTSDEATRILLEATEEPKRQTRIPAAADSTAPPLRLHSSTTSLQAVRQHRVGEQRRFQPRSNTAEYSPKNFGYFEKGGSPCQRSPFLRNTR